MRARGERRRPLDNGAIRRRRGDPQRGRFVKKGLDPERGESNQRRSQELDVRHRQRGRQEGDRRGQAVALHRRMKRNDAKAAGRRGLLTARRGVCDVGVACMVRVALCAAAPGCFPFRAAAFVGGDLTRGPCREFPGSGRDDKLRRGDALAFGPGDLFPVGHAAAVAPASLGIDAPASMVLARITYGGMGLIHDLRHGHADRASGHRGQRSRGHDAFPRPTPKMANCDHDGAFDPRIWAPRAPTRGLILRPKRPQFQHLLKIPQKKIADGERGLMAGCPYAQPAIPTRAELARRLLRDDAGVYDGRLRGVAQPG
jgi:hypothetical protein